MTEEDSRSEKYRSSLDVRAPHFHICNGARPTVGKTNLEGGNRPSGFYQFEAWEVREMVMNHICQIVQNLNHERNQS